MTRQKWLSLFALAAPLALAGCSEGYLAPGMTGNGNTEQTSHALGVYHFSSERYGLAIQFFEQAVQREPRAVDSLNGLGAAYDKLGRFDLAERSYRRALIVNPASAQTLNNLGYSYWLQGRYDLAFAYLRDAENKGGQDPIIAANRQLALAKLEAVPETARPQVAAGPSDLVQSEDLTAARGQDAAAPAATKPWIERTDTKVQTLVTRPSAAVASEIAKSGVRPEMASAPRRPGIAESAPLKAPIRLIDPLSDTTYRTNDSGTARARLAAVEPAATPRRGSRQTAALEPQPRSILLLPLDAAPSDLAQTDAPETEAAAQPLGVAARFDGQPLGPVAWAEDGIAPRSLAALSGELSRDATPRYTRSGGLAQPAARGPDAARAGTRAGVAKTAVSVQFAPSIEVANALGVAGMAARMGRFLRARGLPVDRLSNASNFGQSKTVITYRQGWHAYAMGLASLLPTEVTLMASDQVGSDIRIDLGGDLINFDRRLSAAADEIGDGPAG